MVKDMARDIKYSTFVLEAIKITLFCLITTVIVKLLGANDNTILVILNMAVMSCAASFYPEKLDIKHTLSSSLVIISSVLFGGILGYYYPSLVAIVTIVYAASSILIPRTRHYMATFSVGAVVFYVFAALPFDIHLALTYLQYSGVIIITLVILTYFLDKIIYEGQTYASLGISQGNYPMAFTMVLSMTGATIAVFLLHKYTNVDHLYWVGLTVLVVIQGTKHQTIKTALLRISVNIVGALIVVLLFTYGMPQIFWLNFILLVTFMFFIFALGYSYVLRVLFIELFVLSITHLLGGYFNYVAFDRMTLTLIGGLLVIIAVLITNFAITIMRQYWPEITNS